MRYSALYAAALIAGIASSAHAQSYYSGTLNNEYQRMQQGQPAEPPPVAGREWPSSAKDATRPGQAIGSEGGGAIPALPLVAQISGTVTYLNGGISDEELAQLKAQGDSYNLHLLLSAPTGAFISDVGLRVLNASGTPVLTVSDAGPYVYAQLPPGKYMLEATKSGSAKSVKIAIPSKGSVKSHIVFNE